MRTILAAAVIASAAAHALWAQEPQHVHELGTVTFPVACNAEAQARMNRAVAMLHSFWFPEARKTFESVVEADAGCGIAYWGVAMSHFGNPMAGGSTAEGQTAGLGRGAEGDEHRRQERSRPRLHRRGGGALPRSSDAQ